MRRDRLITGHLGLTVYLALMVHGLYEGYNFTGANVARRKTKQVNTGLLLENV